MKLEQGADGNCFLQLMEKTLNRLRKDYGGEAVDPSHNTIVPGVSQSEECVWKTGSERHLWQYREIPSYTNEIHQMTMTVVSESTCFA